MTNPSEILAQLELVTIALDEVQHRINEARKFADRCRQADLPVSPSFGIELEIAQLRVDLKRKMVRALKATAQSADL